MTRRKLDTPFGTQATTTLDRIDQAVTPSPDSLASALQSLADAVTPSRGDHPATSPSQPPLSSEQRLAALLAEMHTALDARDHARALHAAEDALRVKPDLAVALMCKRECRRLIESACITRIGSKSQVLRVRVSDVDQLGLDPPSRFVLSLIDGRATIATVIERSMMDRIAVLQFVDELVARGIVGAV